MMQKPVIFWFRQDLRLSDNPALLAAVATGAPVIALYVDDTRHMRPWGGASRWWLHHSLQALQVRIEKLGGQLVLRRGEPMEILPALCETTGADAVYLNNCYEPGATLRDMTIKKILTARGIQYHSHKANLLFEPWEIKTKEGNPCRVFTPFWKTCMATGITDAPQPAPKQIHFHAPIASDHLEDWALLPAAPDWAGGLRETWRVGEAAAQKRLQNFIADDFVGYADGRDRPDQSHVSRLSPYLHWGEISPRQIYFAVQAARAAGAVGDRDADKFIAEIGWREFSYHLLYHNPSLPDAPLQPKFKDFPWQENPDHLHAWQRGQTGVPMVDAGMRELWHTGYMHNRVRMIVASYLVKNLLQPWQAGEAWFWDTLVDADLANNSASWQWVAGCGADAAPYFRIFNPFLQGTKFDPNGDYVRRWVPEIAHLPTKFIHTPWLAPNPLGAYPTPIIDFPASRDRALRAFDRIKSDSLTSHGHEADEPAR